MNTYLSERWLFAQACAAAAFTEALLRLGPLPSAARRLGVTLQTGAPLPNVAAAEVDWENVKSVSRAVRRAYKYSRLPDSCLRRSLAAGVMLRRFHPVLRIGVRKDSSELAAHAWLEVAHQTVQDHLGPKGFSADVGFTPLTARGAKRGSHSTATPTSDGARQSS